MRPRTPGIHHVSAIAGDPQENVDFYTEVLGLRLVKRTVNFEDKFMYHLYYGDEDGTPGTLVTFFPYRRGESGRVGRPQPSAVAFAIPEGTAGLWYDRLHERGVDVDAPVDRFDETVIRFRDRDGVSLELVADDSSQSSAANSSVDAHDIVGLHSVTLLSASVFHTAATLEVLGYELLDQDGDRVRYRARGESAAVVDILDVDASYGREGIGTIHHVAFRTGSETLPNWRDRLEEAGLEPTWIKDRRYFESIYFREPGGILFEVATDEPGFTVDEAASELGTSLQLPSQFESDRDMIEQQLPELGASER